MTLHIHFHYNYFQLNKSKSKNIILTSIVLFRVLYGTDSRSLLSLPPYWDAALPPYWGAALPPYWDTALPPTWGAALTIASKLQNTKA